MKSFFQSERLSFRYFREEDFEDYFSLMSNLPVMKMITGKALSRKEAEKKFQDALESEDIEKGLGRFRVSTRDNDDFVGLARLVPGDSAPELGYALASDQWGRGYGSEICKAVIDHARQYGKYKKLMAIVDPENLPSVRILKKNGFVFERAGEYEGLPAEYYVRNGR
ncbi:MAG: GNAT family N-acetyltransferase [Saprospiraceae bacterium]|nr:GNAT family N-acetyltransferase [Saprospiraceae bacterium]